MSFCKACKFKVEQSDPHYGYCAKCYTIMILMESSCAMTDVGISTSELDAVIIGLKNFNFQRIKNE